LYDLTYIMIKSVGHVVVSFILCFLFHMFVALSFYAPPPENESHNVSENNSIAGSENDPQL